MGIYRHIVFPLLCHFGLQGCTVARLRRDLLSSTDGDVLEVGFGTGLNLAFYPPRVRRVVAVDDNPGMMRIARHRRNRAGIQVEYHHHSVEDLPFAPETFRCAVSTFTLCSVGDLPRALTEIHRVLAPGGRFFFAEHGLSRDPGVRRWQRRLNPLQNLVGCGCNLDRDMRRYFEESPFETLDMNEYYLERTPRFGGYMYQGVAHRARPSP